MSTNPQNNSDNQEIDLSIISKKIGSFFNGISMGIFNGIIFIKKHSVVLLSLFVIGAGLGYVLDKKTKVYENQLIVTPNLGSVDYLYNKIDLLESKIKTGDTVFFKSIGIKNSKKILNIEVEPIVDVYSFVNDKTNTVDNAQNTQNFELVKLMAEDGDINKVIKEKTTSKNYSNHNIKISTSGLATEKDIVKPLIAFLNDNEYYQKIQKIYIESTTLQLARGEKTLEQIDALLNKFASINNDKKNDKLVYFNEESRLSDVINTKNAMIIRMMGEKMELITVSELIKLKSSVLNIKDTTGLNNKLKFVFPFILISLYLFIRLFLAFYKKQSLKLQQVNS